MRGRNCYEEIIGKKTIIVKFNHRKYQQLLMEAKLVFQGYIVMSLTEFRDLPVQYGKRMVFTLSELGEIAKAQQEAKMNKHR